MNGTNLVFIVGRVGRDPEIRHMQNNTAVANLSVATSDKWKDKNTGEWQEKTEWHRVVAWRYDAEKVERYVKKGSVVSVVGSLETRKWTDKDGNDKYTTEIKASKIECLDPKDKAPAPDGYNDDGTKMSDDDLPF